MSIRLLFYDACCTSPLLFTLLGGKGGGIAGLAGPTVGVLLVYVFLFNAGIVAFWV